MVGRYLSALKAIVIAAAISIAWGGISPVSATSSPVPGANQSIRVTHIVKYDRREFRLSGGEYYVCKGKYLSYENYRCSHKFGVDPLTAERTLAHDIKEQFGASAVILSASVLQPAGEVRRLEVQVGVPMDGKPESADLYANIELLFQYPPGNWVQKNGEYLVCPEGEFTTFSRQDVCTAPRTVAQWVIGKKIYTTPITVIDHIQQKNGFAAEILNMHVDSNKSLRVTYRKAENYDAAIENTKVPEIVGNNRPQWLDGVGLAGYADHLVVLLIMLSFALYVYAAKASSMSALGVAIGIQIYGWLNLGSTLFFVPLALAPYIYICYKDEVSNSVNGDALRSELLSRERARQERPRAQLGNVDDLRENTPPVQINETPTPERPAAEAGSKPVRKIILD